MDIAKEKLKELLIEAFNSGYENSAEMKEECVDEIIGRWMAHKEEPKQEYRVFKIDELQKMPEGALFHHTTKGRCWIIVKSDGTKCMQFEKGDIGNFINDGKEPWDRPMKLMHAEKS